MDKIEKIRQEIKRLREDILSKVHHLPIHRIELLDELASFLDTLSEEPDKSLEEYASRAGFDYVDGIVQEEPGHRWNDHDVEFAYRDGIIAGADWAMRYQEKKIADAYEKGKQEGVRVVRSWESSPGQGGY